MKEVDDVTAIVIIFIEAAIEKPSGQFLDLIVMSH
jgi:hypothetical protein